MNSKEDGQKNERLSQLLSVTEKNTAEPDKEFLDKLKEKSTAEFLAFCANDTKKSQIVFPIWRIIMKNKITKIAAAAAIIIVAAIGISQLGDSNVAWAKVAQLMENFPAHIHKQSRIVMSDGKKIDLMSSDNVLTYFLPEIGYREDMYDQRGELMMRIYGLLDRKTSITVIPILRQYKVEMLSDDQLSAFNMGIPRIVECIKSGDYEELGRRIINGTETEGIEFTNPFLVIHTGYPIRFDELLFRLWVNVKTSLPVYMEVEATSTDKFLTLWTGGKPLSIKAVMDDFQWYADIDPKELEPDIPDDFVLMADEADGYNEEKAILGLKAFAEVTQGSYPKNLNMPYVLIDGANTILKRLGDDAWLGSNKAQAEVLWRQVICCKSTCLFYDELLRQDKDAAYFGDTVTTKDADAVLMRWKISDSRYRVIFGNLTTKDISADQLLELEGASSQE